MAWRLGLIAYVCCVIAGWTDARAQWQPGGNLVTDSVRMYSTIAMIPDASGGVFTAWEDSRDEVAQIYLQRFATDGAVLWGETGIRIVTAEGASGPRLAGDGAGGVFAAFRSGQITADIQVQRVSAGGSSVWSNPVSASPASGDGSPASVLADGSGGVIVVWWRQGLVEDRGIFAQRIDAAGNRLWGDDAVRVSNYDGTPEICGDGGGGVFITWADRRVMPHLDVYVQHLTAGGSASWATDGLVVCDEEGTQANPQILADGSGGAIVAWRDWGQSPRGIYAQHVDVDGTMGWSPGGQLALSAESNSEEFALAAQGDGGAVMALATGQPGEQDIRAQRIDADGQSLWSTQGVTVCAAVGTQFDPRIAIGTDGSTFVAWRDQRNSCADVFAQKLSTAGSSLWTLDGVMVAVFDEDQTDHVVVPRGSEEIHVLWRDERGDQDRLFLLPVGAAGSGVSEDCVTPTHAPGALRLLMTLQNRPNPFNPTTVFSFTLASDGPVRLIIYDAAGRRVASVVDRVYPAGSYTAVWRGEASNGTTLASGVYFARLTQRGESVVRKVTLVQ